MGNSDNVTPHKASDYDVQIRQTIAMYDWFHEQVLDLVETVCPYPARWDSIVSNRREGLFPSIFPYLTDIMDIRIITAGDIFSSPLHKWSRQVA